MSSCRATNANPYEDFYGCVGGGGEYTSCTCYEHGAWEKGRVAERGRILSIIRSANWAPSGDPDTMAATVGAIIAAIEKEG